jgi:anaerobic ribonucleoside-triphosphate reductase activating protein
MSEANGPGTHFTIWVQGCTLNCPGCFNPNTHNPEGGYLKNVSSIIQEITDLLHKGLIRGVTLTGGEPLQQMDAINHLVRNIKNLGNVGIILLTGYTTKELNMLYGFSELKKFFDVIITGRYKQSLKLQEAIQGSSNKELLFLSSFYKPAEFHTIPPLEIITLDDGTFTITGIKPDLVKDIFD